MADQRASFEAAVVARLKESGFLEIEIRTECLARCADGYQDEVINAGWHYWQAATLSALPAELDGVGEAIAYGKGFWRSCSGCHETNEGVPLGYFSGVLKCHLGGGCFECGGIGAVWDTTDYADMGRFMAEEAKATDEAANDKARLDFLDECNQRLNARYGTTYRWELILNHNVNRLMLGSLKVDLNDAAANGAHSCRAAIDREMERIARARAEAANVAKGTDHEG